MLEKRGGKTGFFNEGAKKGEKTIKTSSIVG